MTEKTLKIRLLRLRGQRIDKAYEIHEKAFFMQGAEYELCQIAGPIDVIALSLMRTGLAWWLCNHSNDVRCAVNNEVIPAQHKVRLSDHDVLEWGLSSWQVASDTRRVSVPSIAQEHSENDLPLATALELSWFDRRMQSSPEDEDPYALIMPTHEAIAAAESPSPDKQEGRKGAASARPDELNILHSLHQEYQQALDNPQEQNAYSWHEYQMKQELAPPSTLTQLDVWSAQANSLFTLQDLVVGSLKIDDIFTGLDSLRESDLFQVEKPPEVLHLFAPAHYQMRANQPNVTPPELTRREHHAISVDSHYRMAQQPSTTTQEQRHGDSQPNP